MRFARIDKWGGWIKCLFIASVCCQASFAKAQDLSCPASPSSAAGRDFSGQNLRWSNFAYSDLTNAKFVGATLTGAVFIGADLTGADFSNATIANSNNATLPTDFSFANLNSACFIGAKFKGPTYFTHATLTRADFSNTDISANAFFGESLQFNAGESPRPAFRNATMDCEFVDDWKDLDLSGAHISACKALLAGQDFSDAEMAGVDLTGFDLTGTQWRKANLSGANFFKATLTNTDFSESQLYGAKLNNANLEGANLSGAFLTNNTSEGINTAANLAGAYLKDVDFSKAQLSGANLTNASFYSNDDCKPCATASGATLNNTQFGGAYLRNVVFSGQTMIQGVQFGNAVLIGADFTGATLSTDPGVGTESGFTAAFLQGAKLGKAHMTGTSLQGAFVDFRDGGNAIYLDLDGNHTNFPGWKTPGQKVCVWAVYGPTTVPTKNATLTCPDGSAAKDNSPPGCGATVADNTHWKSGIDIASANPPASYLRDATYTKAAEPICCPPSEEWSGQGTCIKSPTGMTP
ncbi:MAG: pentapeptide repeat-containing protein [Pseudomonadota bacterium]|nr:pentapeptide repeat-containing protein [Pseudomonadota bacterium]